MQTVLSPPNTLTHRFEPVGYAAEWTDGTWTYAGHRFETLDDARRALAYRNSDR